MSAVAGSETFARAASACAPCWNPGAYSVEIVGPVREHSAEVARDDQEHHDCRQAGRPTFAKLAGASARHAQISTAMNASAVPAQRC